MAIQQTDLTAEIQFTTPEEANRFASMWSHRTLMGHSIGGSTVSIYNITESDKQWIDSYVDFLNSNKKV